MEVMVEMVSSARPPSVSATKGTKSVPEERQAERLEATPSTMRAQLVIGLLLVAVVVAKSYGSLEELKGFHGEPKNDLRSELPTDLPDVLEVDQHFQIRTAGSSAAH